ncbi:MAG: hypothetical protein S0880_35530 [Actinomycetota bacterium]|nr:hypothetical protein [Actinomycetota bacterium]
MMKTTLLGATSQDVKAVLLAGCGWIERDSGPNDGEPDGDGGRVIRFEPAGGGAAIKCRPEAILAVLTSSSTGPYRVKIVDGQITQGPIPKYE